jgi:HNH endonuclease
MKHIELPSQERLAELFDYSIITGIVTRRIRTAPNTVIGSEVGSTTSPGYLNVMVDGKIYYVHRLIWKLVTGQDPGDMVIDHIDGNRLNNSWHNLRLATASNNACNQHKPPENKTGFKGVSKKKRGFVSLIRIEGKKSYLGYFPTPEEAHAAYCEAAKACHGDFARFH